MGILDKIANFAAKKIKEFLEKKLKRKKGGMIDELEYGLYLLRIQGLTEYSMGFRGSRGEMPSDQSISDYVSQNPKMCQRGLNLANKALNFAEKVADSKFFPDAFKQAAKDSIQSCRGFLGKCQEVINDPSDLGLIKQAKQSMMDSRDKISESFTAAAKAYEAGDSKVAAKDVIKARIDFGSIAKTDTDKGSRVAIDGQKAMVEVLSGSRKTTKARTSRQCCIGYWR